MIALYDLTGADGSPIAALPAGRNTALATGNFDGFHRGHRALTDACLAHCAQDPSADVAVFTFTAHPRRLRDDRFLLLSSPAEKRAELRRAGVRYLIEADFADVCDMAPEVFFHDILRAYAHGVFFAAGENFRFGKDAAGTATAMKTLSEQSGCACRVLRTLHCDGDAVSSSAIREKLLLGDCAGAVRMLGRPYALQGQVQSGAGLGHKLGFPTANIPLPHGRVIPADGVYITEVSADGLSYPAVTDIGTKPTVSDSTERICESFLLDADLSLYGRAITVRFYQRLRAEQVFSSQEALSAQIATDVGHARAFFESHPKHMV